MSLLTKSNYLRWLKAAYLYYITPGEDTGMGDSTWDYYAREFYKARDTLPKEEFPVLHHERWDGGSLFFLKKSEYPEEITKD